jgi:hypothetical protein
MKSVNAWPFCWRSSSASARRQDGPPEDEPPIAEVSGVTAAKRSPLSFRQIEANRRKCVESTGPKTEAGKRQSRRIAVRHGLTAETVIGALEDAEDYRDFEAAVIADYDAQSAVERELVSRLASVLWRLRRATIMESVYLRLKPNMCLSSGKIADTPGHRWHPSAMEMPLGL